MSVVKDFSRVMCEECLNCWKLGNVVKEREIICGKMRKKELDAEGLFCYSRKSGGVEAPLSLLYKKNTKRT